MLIAGATGLVAALLGKLLGAGWDSATGIAALLAVGTYLWARDESKRWGELGSGILVSGVVAIALLAIQRDLEDRIREIERERESAQASQNLRLTLGLESDLSQIDLSGQDLRRFVLIEKKLFGATLVGAQLQNAVLGGSDLREINAVKARFDRAVLVDADLRDARLVGVRPSPPPAQELVAVDQASFQGAFVDHADMRGLDLRGVNFRRASLVKTQLDRAVLSGADMRQSRLNGADLRKAVLEGADLRRADLRHARLCVQSLDGVRLQEAAYDDATRWPPGLDPEALGAFRLPPEPKSTLGLDPLETYPPCGAG